MVAKIIEPEVRRALDCIEKGQNFILTGGAGSGKTYSLVSLIEEIGDRYPLQSIVCITYTNNAVAEIRNRITNSNLQVSTIHEFIWSIISKYQVEIKETIVELIISEEQSKFKLPKDLNSAESLTSTYFSNSKIEYDEYYSLKSDAESKISHDHILILAEKMFEKYPKLCDILKDTANFIFVDEYQDTDPLIKNILLNHIEQSKKNNIIGFFGDSMQAIYDTGVGSIDDESLISINKRQNRRNPQAVIELANKLRNDEIEQIPSNDPNAPNMENDEILQGSIKFLYAESIDALEDLRQQEFFENWNFNEGDKTKELWLVHKANAKMAGFSQLYELYNSDSIIELLDKIRKKVDGGIIQTENKTFESIAEESNDYVRGRGNLLVNIKEDSDYETVFEWIKNESWENVNSFRINKDSLLSYKFNGLLGRYESKSQRDKILRYLDSIYELMELYKNKEFNYFLRKTNRKILSLNDKRELNDGMIDLFNSEVTINEIVVKAKRVLKIRDDSFENYITEQGEYLWRRISKLPFNEYKRSIEYQKEYLPFTTQHSIKGSEFDNVLVILDNRRWNKYNFEKMFKNFNSSDSVVDRTRKLFYVCCTRAKRNLVVFMPIEDPLIIEKAKELFGDENVFKCV